jgi:hypothetical protein
MPWNRRERAREIRDARLRHMEEQVAIGALVIGQMTDSARHAWAHERQTRYAAMTPPERARCDAILKERRRRADFLRR